ncbi:MAG: DEAD/DEAH box helicase family protein [Planctomycetaceae bacterium]|jgi:hypothetical protein|nr:DEAD/DEAH box helicase family protein [Planctomycetaceae bacterium]
MKHSQKKPEIAFDKKLVLFEFLLNRFAVGGIKELSTEMAKSRLPEDENGHSEFLIPYRDAFYSKKRTAAPSWEKIEEYDLNIVRHLASINRCRPPEQRIKLKYFQYFTLLFMEYYLDRFTNDRDAFCNELNGFNYPLRVTPFDETEMNKLAVWNATGSGKTLLMHINLLQAKHYFDPRCEKSYLLLTPNEGLTAQHANEFEMSEINAKKFRKESGLFREELSIIEVTKLAEKDGDETVAVESFGNKNILFVDEGHTGASGDKWIDYRKRLCTNGFSFEYSATFGQAVAGIDPAKMKMQNEYAKAIIFDYSYKYFYSDGYGKDYNILNLSDNQQNDTRFAYLTACLLTFYQQKLLFNDFLNDEKERGKFVRYGLENPLLVFVGSSVNAVRKENKQDVSDVVDILLFLKEFIGNVGGQSARTIQSVLNNSAGLQVDGQDAFAHCFSYLQKKYGFTVDTPLSQIIFQDVIKRIYGGETADATMRLQNLRGIDGEISLQLNNAAKPFGIINVGDTGKLLKLCADNGFIIGENAFGHSLFDDIQKPQSAINILIGSKKFTTGWNCYRVSTMGLMNVGRSEGPQIIQLFGRGVRLWGYGRSLKRSTVAQKEILGLEPPPDLPLLETLNIFGIKANYMQNFREYLKNEGVPDIKTLFAPRAVPVLKNKQYRSKKLKKLTLPSGADFQKQAEPFVLKSTASKKIRTIELDCYTALDRETSQSDMASEDVQKQACYFPKIGGDGEAKVSVIDFFDYDKMYVELVEYKYAKQYENVIIAKGCLRDLLADNGWYKLLLPESRQQVNCIADINRFEKYAVRLLKKYFDKQFAAARNTWESKRLQYVEIDDDDANFIDQYAAMLGEKENDASFVKDFETLVNVIQDAHKNGDFSDNGISKCGVGVLDFPAALYRPFLKTTRGFEIIVKPFPLEESESSFIEKLMEYPKKSPPVLEGKELFIIRNKSRKGIAFFETAGFYPDFILWILDAAENAQHIVFVEPHGLEHERFGSEKITLHTRIKEIEKELKPRDGEQITLDSFIISPTKYQDLNDKQNTKEDYENNGVYFAEDDNYLDKLFNTVLL